MMIPSDAFESRGAPPDVPGAAPSSESARRLGPRGLLRRWKGAGWSFLFPRECAWCRTVLAAPGNARGGAPGFCDDCRRDVAPPLGNVCRKCSAPIGPYLSAVDCPRCRDERWAFERTFALGVYEGELRRACTQMKHAGGEPLASGLAGLLWERRRTEWSSERIDAVVPAPHHWWDRVRRPHLAPVALAEELAERLGVPLAGNIVVKSRWTPPQHTLSASERRKSLVNAFRVVGRPRLAGRTLLLVDDVLTTGATAHRVSLALREGGAERVLAAVIARGLGR